MKKLLLLLFLIPNLVMGEWQYIDSYYCNVEERVTKQKHSFVLKYEDTSTHIEKSGKTWVEKTKEYTYQNNIISDDAQMLWLTSLVFTSGSVITIGLDKKSLKIIRAWLSPTDVQLIYTGTCMEGE